MLLLLAVLTAALVFEFANGWNDSANAIATVVSTRVLRPLHAILLASLLNFAGAFLSTRVAQTVGAGLVDPAAVTLTTVFAAVLAAAVWIIACTKLGMPISGSHSLIGALLGAAIVHAGGTEPVIWAGLAKVVVAMLVSPFLGLVAGFVVMLALTRVVARRSYAGVNRLFGRLQVVSVGAVALSHGTNDAQKAMGIITLALFSAGAIGSMQVPGWVIVVCAVVMGLGTAAGGWKVIRTLGVDLFKLQPIHGFAAETSASAVMLGAAGLGLPVSTTHVIASSIMGVGATRKLSAVRWGLGSKIVAAWVFTFPATFALAALLSVLMLPLS